MTNKERPMIQTLKIAEINISAAALIFENGTKTREVEVAGIKLTQMTMNDAGGECIVLQGSGDSFLVLR